LSPADREDAIQLARLEALTWHRRRGSFASSSGEELPASQVAHRLSKHAAARMHKLRARDAATLGAPAHGDDAGISSFDLLPAGEIGDPLERIIAAEAGFGALSRELTRGARPSAARAYVRCVLNDEDLASVAAQMGSRPNTIARANARIHARVVERGGGAIPARRPRGGPAQPDTGAVRAEAAACIEAAGPFVWAVARLLRHGELRRSDGRPDWEAIAGALQARGHGSRSSAAVRASWLHFLQALPRDLRRHAVPQVEWGLRLRDVPAP
jgi:hypothetical protein